MKTIVVLSQKGGAGKTTLTVNLAVAGELDGLSIAVIDVDPQSSATAWGDSRKRDSPPVVSAQVSRLSKILETCKDNGADIAIVDTSPNAENMALMSARQADLILIPCRPSIVDLRAISATIDIAKIAGKDSFVVLNQVQARGALAKEAAEAVKDLGAYLVPVFISSRVAFINAFTNGEGVMEFEPTGKAAQEIRALFSYIKKEFRRKK